MDNKMSANYKSLSAKNSDSSADIPENPEIRTISKTGSGVRKIKLVQSIPVETPYVVLITATRQDYPGRFEAFPNAAKLRSSLRDTFKIVSIRQVSFMPRYSTACRQVFDIYHASKIIPWDKEFASPEYKNVVGRGYLVVLEKAILRSTAIHFDDYLLQIIDLDAGAIDHDGSNPGQWIVDGLKLFITEHHNEASDLPGNSQTSVASSKYEGVQPRVFRVDQAVSLPEYATDGAAGFDLRAYIPGEEPTIKLEPGVAKPISTGLRMAIPEGYELQIRSRSGLAKEGIIVANSPGTVDSDYRGVVSVLLYNQTPLPYTINSGDRIAQGVLAPVIRAAFQEVADESDLGKTERGDGGFGSTGKN